MKVLVYADLQATEGHERLFSDPSMPLQRWRCQKFYSDIARIARDYGCSAVWDAGDTTDDRTAIPIPTVDVILSGIDLLPDSEANIKIVGNHEQFHRNARVHVGRLFAPKFQIVETIDAFVIGQTAVVAVGYPSNLENPDEQISSFISALRSDYKRVVLLGHFDCIGARYNSGQVLQGISRETLAGADAVLLGHIHKAQTIGANIHYIGSPFQQDFGEAGELKRVAILDLDTLSIEWVTMDGYPAYRVVSLQDFENVVSEDTEDRFQVILTDHAESARFYAHPLSSRAKPVYAYSSVEPDKASDDAEVQDWNLDTAIDRWISSNPPQNRGISLSASDMKDFGLALVDK